MELKLLTDQEGKRAVIGRKKSRFEKEGFDRTFLIGRVEEEPFKDVEVYMDAVYPHIVFICGMRGSGKSYTLGVIAEGLVESNPDVGVVIVDPMGIYWSMKKPNMDPEERKMLEEWGLDPRGYPVRVLVPRGAKNVPKGTYDGRFSISVSDLTVEDWCLTFGIDRFSPQGLLLEALLEKMEGEYGIEEMVGVLKTDESLRERESGFKRETIRALASRLSAARKWGILSKRGTPLKDIVKRGQITVIDVSFLQDNVSSLVIGILARKILEERKKSARLIATGTGEETIPPTWLLIDEAHTLIPGGNRKTPATDALVEYVKQGRRPGCSLVFATQQPGAINPQVLSQLDLLFIHKLVFEDDIRSVVKRTPNILLKEHRPLIRKLPVGVAIVGDKEDTSSRAFFIKIRPRKSQHEGRDITSAKKEERKERVEEGESFVIKFSREKAEDLLRKFKAGLFGKNKVESLELVFSPVYEVTYRLPNGETRKCYIDGAQGEFLHENRGFVFSKGLKHLFKLSRNQVRLVYHVYRNPGISLKAVIFGAHIPGFLVEQELRELAKSGILEEKEGKYRVKVPMELPPSPDHPALASPDKIPRMKTEIEREMHVNYPQDRVENLIRGMWPGVAVLRIRKMYRPLWVGIVVKGNRKEKVTVDAVHGKVENVVSI